MKTLFIISTLVMVSIITTAQEPVTQEPIITLNNTSKYIEITFVSSGSIKLDIEEVVLIIYVDDGVEKKIYNLREKGPSTFTSRMKIINHITAKDYEVLSYTFGPVEENYVSRNYLLKKIN